MLSYSIGVAADGSPAFGDMVATAYDKEKVALLRDAGYDGVIMTDWRVTHNIEEFGGPRGKEKASVEERHYAVLQSDVDMYGGNNDIAPLKAATTCGRQTSSPVRMRSTPIPAPVSPASVSFV